MRLTDHRRVTCGDLLKGWLHHVQGSTWSERVVWSWLNERPESWTLLSIWNESIQRRRVNELSPVMRLGWLVVRLGSNYTGNEIMWPKASPLRTPIHPEAFPSIDPCPYPPPCSCPSSWKPLPKTNIFLPLATILTNQYLIASFQ